MLTELQQDIRNEDALKARQEQDKKDDDEPSSQLVLDEDKDGVKEPLLDSKDKESTDTSSKLIEEEKKMSNTSATIKGIK
jgi:hypothetical protein